MRRFTTFHKQHGTPQVSAPSKRPRPWCPPMHRATLAAHMLAGGRYSIPAKECEIPAESVAGARREIIRLAHIEIRAAPWRDLVRQSWPHSSAEPVEARRPRRTSRRRAAQQASTRALRQAA